MLELYQFESCPFCRKVREKLEELNIDYICRTAGRESSKHDIIVKMGGLYQVPFLVNIEKNIFMYESDDIVEYLEKNYS